MTKLNYPIIEYPRNIQRKLESQLTTVSFLELDITFDTPADAEVTIFSSSEKKQTLNIRVVIAGWFAWVLVLVFAALISQRIEIFAAVAISILGAIPMYKYLEEYNKTAALMEKRRDEITKSDQRRKSLARMNDCAFIGEKIDWSDNIYDLKRSNDSYPLQSNHAVEYLLKHLKLHSMPGVASYGHVYTNKDRYHRTCLELIIPNGLGIDIEIDQPYQGLKEKPLHCWDDSNADMEHGAYFLGNGWIVARFTEKQVITNPQGCCGIIAELLIELTQDTSLGKIAKQGRTLKRCPQWSSAEAQAMAKQGYRKQYLREQ